MKTIAFTSKNSLFYFLFFVFFFGFTLSCYSQNKQKSDSIISILNQKKKTKREKIILLNLLAHNHPKNDTALFVLKEALQLSKEIKAPILEAEIWEEIVYTEKRLGNNINSLNAAFKALAIYESLTLKKEQGASYIQIADHYTLEKDYLTAITYLQKAKVIYTNSKDIFKQTLTLLNLGELYRLSNKLDLAEVTFLEVLKLNKNLNEKDIKAYTVGNLGMVYNTQNKLNLAEKNLTKAIQMLNVLGDSYAVAIYLNEIGKVYEKRNKITLAEQKFIAAFQLANKNVFKEQIRDFSKQLARFYKKETQFKKAFEYQELFQKYQDSLVNKKNIQKIEQIKTNYLIDKKETEITVLNTLNKNQKNTLISLTTGVSILILMSYLLYKENRKTKKANSLLITQKNIITKREKEKAVLLKELNHRTKNNLQMIASLLSLQSNKLTGHPAQEAILAGKYRVEALSLVHRKLYQEGVDSKINIKEYIEELILGLFYGYNANFSPELNIDAIHIHIDTAVPLALIINELIINALKYAYKDIEKPTLEINIQQNNTKILMIDIKDNGIGFNAKKEQKNHSFGLKLLNSLVQQLDGSIEQILNKGTHWKINLKTS